MRGEYKRREENKLKRAEVGMGVMRREEKGSETRGGEAMSGKKRR